MRVLTEYFSLTTRPSDILDITENIQNILNKHSAKEGIVCISVIGSTAALTTLEYEPALVSDLTMLLNKIIPQDKSYAHDQTWGDANGFSHLRSTLLGTSLTFPVTNGTLELGTWQQIIFLEFDTRKRSRKIVVKYVGE